MPYGRQLRLDRRRRVLRDNILRDNILRSAADSPAPKPSARSPRSERTNSSTPPSGSVTLVGYSQEVRGPCQQRLVHFIPVRPSTLTAVIGLTFLSIGLLVGLHYMVWIAGPNSWRATPLSLLLDVRSRVGLAGWVNIQLWLIIAILCGMIFQIRKHRLDDYRAHYRVWLWLAIASLLASIEAGTGLTQVVAASVEPFGRLNFGWSGRTLVEVSIATAVGMLALRICSELRASTISQILWLVGLICWVPSALLASQLIKTNLGPDYVHLYIGALWLSGKMFVMLAALIYLRQVYIAAQRRFVERSRLSQTSWSINWNKLLQKMEDAETQSSTTIAKVRKSSRKKDADEDTIESETRSDDATENDTAQRRRIPNIGWSTFSSWVASGIAKIRLPKVKLRKRKANPPETSNAESVVSEMPSAPAPKSAPSAKKNEAIPETRVEKPKRKWRIPRPNLSGIFSLRKWIRLPSLASLNPIARLQLKPPSPAVAAPADSSNKNGDTKASTSSKNSNMPRPNNGPLPSTAPLARLTTQTAPAGPNQPGPLSQANRTASQQDDDDLDDDDYDNQDRKLSKAERKRLKRLQQEQRRNAA